MKVLSRGITEDQQGRIGIFLCPACTSRIEFGAYDLTRWSGENGTFWVQCPVCGATIPDTAKEVSE